MSVALFTHPAVLGHDTGPEHPECADRIRYILRALETPEFVPLLREIAPKRRSRRCAPAHTRRISTRFWPCPATA